jgi:hypothetical protein
MACRKLHNYCINNNDETVPIPREGDLMNVVLDGGIPLDSNLDCRPLQLLDGGKSYVRL